MKSASNILPALPRRMPRHPWPEGFLALGMGALTFFHYGLALGLIAAVLQWVLMDQARHAPARVVAFLALAFALPKLELDPASPFYLRIEDFVIVALCVAGLRSKTEPGRTPLDSSIALFVGALAVTACSGLFFGSIASPASSALTILKSVELLCGFFAAAWILHDADARKIVAHGFLAGISMLAVVGALFVFLTPHERPFDAFPYRGESNHVAAYAVLASFLFVTQPAPRRRWMLGTGIAMLLIFCTASRTAMIGLGAGLIVLAFALRARLILGPLIAGILLSLLLPGIRERISMAPAEWNLQLETERQVEEGYPPIYSGNRVRVEVWGLLMDEYKTYPLAGTGPGSRQRILYENQVMMTLCESGLLGLAAFFFLLWSAWRTFRRGGTPESCAALAALSAMMIMSLTSNAFTISRMAGPFWILAGLAIQSPIILTSTRFLRRPSNSP